MLFADADVTKRELIEHYVSVANRMLPHIVKRPISLVRCPDGKAANVSSRNTPQKVSRRNSSAVPIREKSGKKDYLFIEDLQGLVAAVQMGALELHLWGAHDR